LIIAPAQPPPPLFPYTTLFRSNLHLILGAILVALTTFFFLHDWRGTVIACVAIPTSIISTFVLIRGMGYTLNNFTMLGLERRDRSEEHTSELQSLRHLVCRLLL